MPREAGHEGALRGPDTMSFVRTDTPLPNLVVGKVYEVGGVFGEFIHVFDETCEGAVWPQAYFEPVEESAQPVSSTPDEEPR